MYQIYSCHIFIYYRYQLMRLLNLLVLKKTQANSFELLFLIDLCFCCECNGACL